MDEEEVEATLGEEDEEEDGAEEDEWDEDADESISKVKVGVDVPVGGKNTVATVVADGDDEED